MALQNLILDTLRSRWFCPIVAGIWAGIGAELGSEFGSEVETEITSVGVAAATAAGSFGYCIARAIQRTRWFRNASRRRLSGC
jgi:hypothetical protein